MRLWIIAIQYKSRKEYPSFFLFEGSTEEGRELEERIRRLFDAGKIKDFAFEPISKSSRFERVSAFLDDVEGRRV